VAFRKGGRAGDVFYRDRWSHDKVVRSTHGVNCTGSCSWKIYVRDGIITWEAQQTDYPSVGPDRPEYEPRGCPRGAAFSWYTYSPTRVRYPYARGVLLEMYREAKQRLGDPVLAWADVVTDPERRRRYHQARGKGGLVRVTWAEAVEMIAAAQVHTIKTYGPDRIANFSPIPAMSMVSHCVGTRFNHLVGGAMTSFYDWYADLPVASPQVFGDQTDVPESGDWWDATYLMMWGSNVPVTRTPDAHWMTEVRYRGTKVVTVSPDYADNTKFADEWLAAQAGTDAALAMAMGHVILKEFFVDRQVPFRSLRIPMEYLAELFTAGDVSEIERVLTILAAMRAHMRNITMQQPQDDSIAASVGMTDVSMREMYRLMAIAKYDERYVIPKAHVEQAHELEELGCSLDFDGGPYEQGAFGEASGRPSPVAVETSMRCGNARPPMSAFPGTTSRVG
jgi:nitrate reductase alpha subunit